MGRRVILDLTYCNHSVNNYTEKDQFDGSPFKLCPVQALSSLLQKFCLQPNDPLFMLADYHLSTQSHLRSRLVTFLRTMGIPLEAHGFNTFCRSAAIIAYDTSASLTAIKSHGLWSSDVVWSYISDNTSKALQIPLTFQHFVNTTLS